ncbi:hypothetical protein Brms1b_009151 [Colletotrichum noveboracense]|nr:hypothetical protein Brms1b_009151 [Colletotrichum noveboracense]
MDCSADEMDEATLQLVLQLQQADLKELQDEAKEWNNKDGLLRDADLAFEMYQEELSSLETFATARQLGQRLNEEEEADEKKEAAEGEDELGETENRYDDIDAGFPTPPRWWETFMPARFARWRGEIRREKCDMCTDEYPQTYLFQTTCNHKYCPGCIIDLFEASINDESLFPPRCCGNVFSTAEHEHVLGYELLERWRVKEIEYTTPNRTYCHVPTCSAFIPPSKIDGDVGYCPVDCHSTCTLCKGPAHPHHACEQDQATQEVLRIAAENNWQRCTHCQAIVELNQGCYHISELTIPLHPIQSGRRAIASIGMKSACSPRARNESTAMPMERTTTPKSAVLPLNEREKRSERTMSAITIVGEAVMSQLVPTGAIHATAVVRSCPSSSTSVDIVGSSLAADADTIVSKAR